MKKIIFGYQRPLLVRSCRLLIVIMALTLLVSARGYSVYGRCMEPELITGERLIASPVDPTRYKPRRGDVVIFQYPGDKSVNYVKRVIGTPGDIVEIKRGRLILNGRELKEPYKLLDSHGDFGPETVKAGNLFVLGDNRDVSNDSRFWGELPVANVEAKAVFHYWPPSRWGYVK